MVDTTRFGILGLGMGAGRASLISKTEGADLVCVCDLREEKARKISKELGCDYASFNIATPRMGTDLREEAIKRNWVSKDETLLDSSFSVSMEASPGLSAEKLARLQKKANREFYLRPSYIIKRILGVRSPGEMLSLIREGIFLVSNIFRSKTSSSSGEGG